MGNNNIAKLAKWTILDANNPANRDVVTPFDDVCLKSPFGNYLTVESNFVVCANGPAINDDSTFKIVKADIPYLPDWLFKRPHLNHNVLSSRGKVFYDKNS